MASKLTATLEDYLGVVLKYQRLKHFARVSDIAADLGVAKSAVTAALRRLSSEGLLNYKPYEPVTLTHEGEERAERIVLRHRIILDFLQGVLGVEPARAESVACEMEHGIDSRTLERFVCFLAFIRTRSSEAGSWLEEFREFSRGGTEGRSCRECIEAYLKVVRRDMAAS